MPASDFPVDHVVMAPSFSRCVPAAARCPDTLPPCVMVPASGWSWLASTSRAASTSSQKPRNSPKTDVPPDSFPALKPMVEPELIVTCAAVMVFAPPIVSVLSPDTSVFSSPVMALDFPLPIVSATLPATFAVRFPPTSSEKSPPVVSVRVFPVEDAGSRRKQA